jgi:hypothetical protein
MVDETIPNYEFLLIQGDCLPTGRQASAFL